MKRFSAQYTISNTGPPLKRSVITTEDDGTIISIENTNGKLEEAHSVEFYNGIIIPGFVNCHCHLELSHMKDSVRRGTGLGGFIEQIRNTRNFNNQNIRQAAYSADNLMLKNGIVLCADICNTSETFTIKKESSIKYLNLLEVFGIDPDKAGKRMNEIQGVEEEAKKMNLPFSIVPHSVYSMSLTLLRLVREAGNKNTVTSIHFMETAAEETFLNSHNGPLMVSYKNSGLIPDRLEIPENHETVILKEITASGNLILIHNTFTDRKTIEAVKEREHIYWCMCPNSNLYIENKIPQINMFIDEGCEIVIGTDSLSSNSTLNILQELKTIQINYPDISITELIKWATLNGAKALGEQENFGSIEPGKKPGLLILENVDLQNMKLLPDSSVTRLI